MTRAAGRMEVDDSGGRDVGNIRKWEMEGEIEMAMESGMLAMFLLVFLGSKRAGSWQELMGSLLRWWLLADNEALFSLTLGVQCSKVSAPGKL